MIPSTEPSRQTADWRRILAQGITEPAELLALLGLDRDWLGGARRGARLFALRVPRGFVRRMRHGDPGDPLLRQVLPLDEETRQVEGFGADAVGDLQSLRGTGVLQKYRGRALLIVTGACAIHCRYCFRRHFPYQAQTAARKGWTGALAVLEGDPSISEVILSGGDPLVLGDDKLAGLADLLGRIPHLRRLRIHTRLPIVLPERVDGKLLAWLDRLPMEKVVVVHANHANEIDAAVGNAMADLRACGATLLNQSVLLRGVNDSAPALAALSETLFAAGVLPYYLHQLDRVAGSAHFEVPDHRAAGLMQNLLGQLPGYLVPRLVREVAGAPSKIPLAVAPGTG